MNGVCCEGSAVAADSYLHGVVSLGSVEWRQDYCIKEPEPMSYDHLRNIGVWPGIVELTELAYVCTRTITT